MLHKLGVLSCLLSAATAVSAQLYWNSTQFLFTLGDSYTTDGFNISEGVNSTNPGYTSSNGPNWVEYLGGTYNVTNTKVFNLASGGATIDAALVAPYLPTVLSIVDQVSQFEEYLAPKPYGAQWDSSNSLFAIWIGINDVITGALADYNDQLIAYAGLFEATHSGTSVRIFDPRPVFNTLLDNYPTFGYVNITGYCEAYENGTPSMTTQDAPCEPVSSYFWLNTLHPLYTVHNILAHAIATALDY
ncbi:hypothetical protein EVJ58_g8338 [Rhodofomes roseus]|uniref:Carbohydrate esterase family 16 protein n=1 Tax=Rhodofomes roseus TaxID=34475 RepID=A0A4Y9XYR1_9APHY|nr:hypothetical protein EVJ58_g8338 [Rhodofomes roseus]